MAADEREVAESFGVEALGAGGGGGFEGFGVGADRDAVLDVTDFEGELDVAGFVGVELDILLLEGTEAGGGDGDGVGAGGEKGERESTLGVGVAEFGFIGAGADNFEVGAWDSGTGGVADLADDAGAEGLGVEECRR